MTLKMIPFDASEYIETPEEVAAFLEEAFESGDVGFIVHAIGVVAKARGMTRLAEETGLARPALYRALRVGANPKIATLLNVLRALGIKLVPAVDAAAGSGPPPCPAAGADRRPDDEALDSADA